MSFFKPKVIAGIVGILIAILLIGNIFVNLDIHQLMCIQNPLTGHITWHVTAGPKWQFFGKVTKYDKRSIYRFKQKIRFYEGGHATMYGSIQFTMPLDVAHLNLIQSQYGTEEAVKSSLLSTAVNKVVYMTGPTMTSKESYGEKRNYLINYIEDQLQYGVYKTVSRDTVIKDDLTKTEKTVTKVEIVKSTDGKTYARQEEPVLTPFGIIAFNFALDSMPYEEAVESQIREQQKLAMDVQTAIADAKKAEQNKITVEANGAAAAAKTEWAQKAINATSIAIAEKNRDSCKLAMQAADFKKQANILEGQGIAEKERLIMAANGNMDKKINGVVKINEVWAEAMTKYGGNLVPQISWGGEKGTGGNAATDFMNMMSMQAAKQFSIDMSLKAGTAK